MNAKRPDPNVFIDIGGGMDNEAVNLTIKGKGYTVRTVEDLRQRLWNTMFGPDALNDFVVAEVGFDTGSFLSLLAAQRVARMCQSFGIVVRGVPE